MRNTSRRDIIHGVAGISAAAASMAGVPFSSIALGQARQRAAPSDLGRGVLSITGGFRRLLSDVSGVETEQLNESIASFDFVESRSSYSSLVAFSASAKFGYTGGAGGLSVSSTQTFQSSSRRLSIVMSQLVRKENWFLRNPEASDVALSVLRDSVNNQDSSYARAYGDAIIRSVVLGGSLAVVYSLEFSTETETNTFKADLSASLGADNASASFVSEQLRSAASRAATVEAVCKGVDSAPELFANSVGDERGTPVLDFESAGVADALILYFQDFPNRVTHESMTPVDYIIEKQADIVANININRLPNFDAESDQIERATRLDDIIDRRLAQVRYIREVASRWNPQATPALLTDAETQLTQQRTQLEEEVARIARLEAATIEFGEDEIFELPEDWRPRDLQVHSVSSDRARNDIVEVELAVPDVDDETVVGVKYYASHGGGGSRAGNFAGKLRWLNKDGAMVKLEKEWPSLQHGISQQILYMTIPEGAVSLHLSGRTYDRGDTNIHIQFLL